MNPENLKFLQDRLFYLGTEKKLFPELEKNMAEGKPEFTLPFSNQYDQDKLNVNLHFRKSDQTELYFLNRYDATLQKPGGAGVSRSFKLENGKGMTMKEAYNLLDGRAVNKDLKNKEGVTYNAWVKLDFASKDEAGQAKILQYHKNYGFDLQAELFKLPLPNMPAQEFNKLTASLERGNVQQVRLDNVPAYPAVWVEANPQYKTLNLADEQGRSLSRDDKMSLHAIGDMRKALGEGAAREQKQELPAPEKKEKLSVARESGPEQKNAQKKTMKEKAATLLPKKHTGHKKGLTR
jgi:hypothetical protein